MSCYKVNILEKNLSEPWFSLIKLGIKKVEGRLNKGEFANMNIKDLLIFINNELGFERRIMMEIKDITYYDNFQTYLETETLERCLPGIHNIEDGLKVYYKYYTKNDELKYKIKVFTFQFGHVEQRVF
jgi:ASC-1-like (ASCH) protein